MSMLPRGARVFISCVLVLAALAELAAVLWMGESVDWLQLGFLAALYVATESLLMRGSRDNAGIALSSIPAMAALPLVGGEIVTSDFSRIRRAHGPAARIDRNLPPVRREVSSAARPFDAHCRLDGGDVRNRLLHAAPCEASRHQ